MPRRTAVIVLRDVGRSRAAGRGHGGLGAFVVGAVGLADGLIYDLRLKRTALAWTAFSVGVGLLPLYAWLGARGRIPTGLLGVIALAVVAGVALSLANAYADLETDRRSGEASVATLLGPARTLWVDACLLAVGQCYCYSNYFGDDRSDASARR